MSINNRTSKPYTEYFFVLDSTKAVKVTGNIDAFDLTANQMGVISAYDYPTHRSGNFIPAATTAVNVPSVKLVQRIEGDLSNAWTPYVSNGMLMSGELRKCEIQSVSCVMVTPTRSMTLISNFCPIVCGKFYSVYVTEQSQRNKNKFGDYNNNIGVTTFDAYQCCDDCITPPVDNLDYALHHLITDINKQSTLLGGKNNYVAIGINMNGTATDPDTGTAISGLTLGDVIQIGTIDGVAVEITMDAAFIQSFYEATQSTALTGTETIVLIDNANAGAATLVNAVLFVGLTEDKAYGYSGIPMNNVELRVEMGGSFQDSANKPVKKVLSGARTQTGLGSIADLWYEMRAFGQDGGTELAGFSDTLVKRVSRLNPDADYKFCAIDSFREDGNSHHVNQRIWIATEMTVSAATSTVAAGVLYTAISPVTPILNAVLGAWITGQTYCDNCAEYFGLSVPPNIL